MVDEEHHWIILTLSELVIGDLVRFAESFTHPKPFDALYLGYIPRSEFPKECSCSNWRTGIKEDCWLTSYSEIHFFWCPVGSFNSTWFQHFPGIPRNCLGFSEQNLLDIKIQIIAHLDGSKVVHAMEQVCYDTHNECCTQLPGRISST